MYRTPPSTSPNRQDNPRVSGGVARRVDWENRRGTDTPQGPWCFDPDILAARTRRDQVYSELLEESEYRCQPIHPIEAETMPTRFAQEQQHSWHECAGKGWCRPARAPLPRNARSRRSGTLPLIHRCCWTRPERHYASQFTYDARRTTEPVSMPRKKGMSTYLRIVLGLSLIHI